VSLLTDLQPSRQELKRVDARGNSALHHAAATLNLELVKHILGVLVPDSEVGACFVQACVHIVDVCFIFVCLFAWCGEMVLDDDGDAPLWYDAW
jgi:hypothetical protein